MDNRPVDPIILEDDLKYLDWLSIGHCVYGSLIGLGALAGLLFLGVGIVATVVGARQEPDARAAGVIFLLIGVFFTLLAGAYATAVFIAGRNLKRRRKHSYCVVMGAIDCAWAPLGTILGIFTLIVLLRPSVRHLFDQPQQPVPGADAL